jgi:hypothetical protein
LVLYKRITAHREGLSLRRQGKELALLGEIGGPHALHL